MSSSADTVLRVRKDRNYKTISTKAVADDDRLSWKAKGLHTYLVSRPDGWKFRHADLVNRASDGKYSVTSGIEKLEACGYLRIEHVRDNGRFAGTVWTVSEVPMASGEAGAGPYPENQDAAPNPDFPDAESPGPENPTRSNEKGSKKERSSGPSLRSGPAGGPGEVSWGFGWAPAEDEFRPDFVAVGVRELFWHGVEPPANAPSDWDMSAELGILRRVWEQVGTRGLVERMHGLRMLVDAGEISGLEAGAGFTSAFLLNSRQWSAESLWSKAERAFQEKESSEGSDLLHALAAGVAAGTEASRE